MAEELILKFSKSMYQTKINELESYKTQLNGHLTNLESYRDQIQQFWDDDQAKQLYNNLSSAMRNVRTQSNRIDGTITQLQKSIDQMGEASGITDNILNIITAKLDSLTSDE